VYDIILCGRGEDACRLLVCCCALVHACAVCMALGMVQRPSHVTLEAHIRG